jgi:chromosome segregation ATPase
MELIVILLCAMSGALIGTAIGILLMFRKIRQPITEAEVATLKATLKSSEGSLAASNADLENLRRQIAERDLTIQWHEEALKENQQHLDLAVAERAATEQRARELGLQAEALTEQRTQLEARVKEEKDRGAEVANQQVASYKAQLDTEKQQVRELTEQVAKLRAEETEIRGCCEQEKIHRSSLETRLAAELERIRELATQIRELQSERSLFDLRLQEERQSAARGMEMLLKAQESFARVFESRSVDAPNGSNGHATLEGAGAIVEMKGDTVENLHPALAAIE